MQSKDLIMNVDKVFSNIADEESPDLEVEVEQPSFDDLWNYRKELYQFCVIVNVKNAPNGHWFGPLDINDLNKIKQRIEIICSHITFDVPEIFIIRERDNMELVAGTEKLTYAFDTWKLPIFFNMTKEDAPQFVRLVSSLFKKLKLKNCQIELSVFRTEMGYDIFNDIRNKTIHYQRKQIDVDMNEVMMISFLEIDEHLKDYNTYDKIYRNLRFPIDVLFNVETL